MKADAKWPGMVGGGRRAPAPASAYTLLATSPPTSIGGNDGCSPHYPPAAAAFDDDSAGSFESRQLGVADWLRLQKQSSGSSAGGDDGDGDDSVSTLATADKGDPADRPPGSSGGIKSWAQQAEEAYRLQLVLALRLCSEASTAPDPNFLDSAAAADDHHHHAASPLVID